MDPTPSLRGARSKPLFLSKCVLCYLNFCLLMGCGVLVLATGDLEDHHGGILACGLWLLASSVVALCTGLAYLLLLPPDSGCTRLSRQLAKEIGNVIRVRKEESEPDQIIQESFFLRRRETILQVVFPCHTDEDQEGVDGGDDDDDVQEHPDQVEEEVVSRK